MKRVFGIMSLAAVSKATFERMEQHLQKLYNDTLRSQGISDRNVASMMGPSISVIDGYGCWCYRPKKVKNTQVFKKLIQIFHIYYCETSHAKI